MAEFEHPQFSTFKDCIAQKLLQTTNGTKEAQDSAEGDGLDEFASYLAMEAWPTVPTKVKEATYETREKVPDIDSISLESISAAFVESLVSYDIVPDADDALKFLRKAVSAYLDDACSPPPVWKSTRTDECGICFREVPLTYHHLIPRSTHAKVLKKGWHPKTMLNSVAWLCRPCHTAVHSVATNDDLAQNFHTVELLLQREDIQKWQKYAAKQRFRVRRG